MKTFQYQCVSLADVCEANKLDYTSVMDRIASSDVSFGTNDDTLITPKTLENIMGFEIVLDGLEDVMISLGS
jgi:hypothetical protein